MTYYDIVARTLVTFLVLFFLIKLTGKKQISQLTFFNYVTGITIGAIAASTCLNSTLTLMQGLSSLVVWVGLTILAGYLTLNLHDARVLIHGEPMVVINNGQILKESLAALRLTTDELSMLMRREKIFDLSKVDFAIFEPNGKLSVLEKPDQQLLTKKDMRIAAPAFKYLPTDVIKDGTIVDKNLQKMDLDKEWVLKQVQAQGYNTVEEIFYAQMQSDGSLYLAPQVNVNAAR